MQPRVVKNHPNTSLAATIGLISVFVAWIAGIIGVVLSAEAGAGLATLLVATSLFIGKRGIKGLISGIWNGFKDDTSE